MLLGASCGPGSGHIGPIATPATAVTRKPAIELVTQNCLTFDLALAGEPHNIQAALIKGKDAIKEISGQGYVDLIPLKQV